MSNSIPILSASGTFTRKQIDAFERTLLTNPSATEHDASDFFTHHPAFLHMGVGAESRREIVMLGSAAAYRVDFFRRSFGNNYWDIIELKRPNIPLVIALGTNHPRLSSFAQAAISQALDYRDCIITDRDVRDQLATKGIAVCRPRLTVVLGQDPDDIEHDKLAVLLDRVHALGPVELLTYTAMYRFAVEHFQSTGQLVFPSLHFEVARDPSAKVELRDDRNAEHDHVISSAESGSYAITRLFVGNVPFRIDGEELRALFESVGAVVDFFWPTDRETGRKKGFAFVDVDTYNVEDVIERLNGREVMGRQLAVSRSLPRDVR